MIRNQTTKISIAIIIILHVVGTIGTLHESTRSLVIGLTPINLALSSLILIINHANRSIRFWIFVLLSITLGYVAEVVGVATKMIFGEYQYGAVLGFQVFEVPLIIGLNWFMLSYAIGAMVNRYVRIAKPLIAAVLMVILDVIIEPVAVKLDYWSWVGDSIPLQNYLGWFVISLIIQFSFQQLLPQTHSKIAIPLILSQIGYFIGILLFL